MQFSMNQPFAKKMRAIFSVRTRCPLTKKNYTNCWILARRGIGIARTGYIRITSRIRWGFASATREHVMKRLKY
jgi:hypothetical protein